MVKAAATNRDIAVLMLIKAKATQQGPWAKELSTLREVQKDGTVYGVRWTAVTHAEEGTLRPYGVFAAVRGRDEADLKSWGERIHQVLSGERSKSKSAQSEVRAHVMSAAPEDPTDGLVVEDFWRNGSIEPMGHNGLP